MVLVADKRLARVLLALVQLAGIGEQEPKPGTCPGVVGLERAGLAEMAFGLVQIAVGQMQGASEVRTAHWAQRAELQGRAIGGNGLG